MRITWSILGGIYLLGIAMYNGYTDKNSAIDIIVNTILWIGFLYYLLGVSGINVILYSILIAIIPAGIIEQIFIFLFGGESNLYRSFLIWVLCVLALFGQVQKMILKENK